MLLRSVGGMKGMYPAALTQDVPAASPLEGLPQPRTTPSSLTAASN